MSEQTDKPEYVKPTLHEHGMTEFHMAAYHGDLAWIEDCIARGLNTEVRDAGNNTPLHWVVDMSMVNAEPEEVVDALLEAGADINARRFGGETVLMVAVLAGNRDVIHRLIKSGASVTAKNDKGQTAYSYAASRQVWEWLNLSSSL